MSVSRLIERPSRSPDDDLDRRDSFEAARRRGGPPVPSDDLDRDTFEAVRLAVAERLRREYHQTASFAAETADEMVSQAYIEYREKPAAERSQVRSLPGLLITSAVHRSIDKARREGREVYGEGAQAIIASAEDRAESTEGLAVRLTEAQELYEAVQTLHHEEREALTLLFWEGLTTREAGEQMNCGRQTVIRRRDDAMAKLRKLFGVDPDKRETGFSAWAGLTVGVGHAQTQTHIVTNAGDQLAAGAETAQHGFASLVHVASGLPGRAWHGASSLPGRVRDLAVRTFSTGNTEPITTAVGNGSAGVAAKGVGRLALIVCGGAVGAAAGLCGAGLVGVGPGASLFQGDGGTAVVPSPAHTREYVPPAPRQPTPSRKPSRSHSAGKHPHTRHHARRPNRSHYPRKKDKNGGHHYTPQSEHAARTQGIESQAPSPEPEPAPEPAPEPEPEYTGGEAGGGGGPSAAETENTRQFDLP